MRALMIFLLLATFIATVWILWTAHSVTEKERPEPSEPLLWDDGSPIVDYIQTELDKEERRRAD